MSVSALDNVVTFAGEVLFERKSPTANMQEAIPCEQIDLRKPAKPEIPNTEDEEAEEALLISNLTTHVLHSPNKSMLIADLIKNFAQQKRGNVDDPMSHNDSEIHAARRGNLERPEVSKSEDRLRCRRCLSYSRPGEKFCGCGRDEVRTQAEQRICSRFIMYVPGIDDSALENAQRGRRHGTSQKSQKLKRAKDYLDSARKHHCGRIVERYPADEQCQPKDQPRFHQSGTKVLPGHFLGHAL